MKLSRGGAGADEGVGTVPSIILLVQYALDAVEVGGCGALRPAVRTTLQDHMQLCGVMWVQSGRDSVMYMYIYRERHRESWQ